MKARSTSDASVEKTGDGWRLRIKAGDARAYRGAQIDDYSELHRSRFPHHPLKALQVSLSARVSASFAAGTWGFGLWNDPFGLSFGFGGNPFHLPALPNAAWFFYASPQNYLSFADDKPARGFLAQTFRSPPFHPLLIPAGLALPFSPKTTRRFLSRVIAEDSNALSADTTQWRRYSLEWSATRVTWEVDEVRVFESLVSPRPPLGFIVWMDNQFAAFTPEGKISAGVLDSGEAWLEAREIAIRER
jgi:hypothetical protein